MRFERHTFALRCGGMLRAALAAADEPERGSAPGRTDHSRGERAAARAPRVVIAAGGTGGHVFPALAVAQALERRVPHVRIEFVGTARGPERRWITREGYPLKALPLRGLKGGGLLGKLAALASACWGTLRCLASMRRERPALVIGAGGYASAPAVVAGKLLGARTMLLEQNHFPGAANRWLARYVDLICVPSERAGTYLRGRTAVTGNPIREPFTRIAAFTWRTPPTVLVLGGSRGARSINRAVCAALAELGRLEPPPRLVHQTGVEDFEDVRRAYAAYPSAYEVAPFFDDLAARCEEAQLVVARAGATTVAELAAAGRPALLVPYPYAADDHQRVNAAYLAEAGAARVVEDRELTGPRLAREIESLLQAPERLAAMARAARALARPEAAARVAELAASLACEGGAVAEATDVP